MAIQKQVKSSEPWDNRTRIVVYGQAFLLLLVWCMALGPRISDRFWNAKENEERLKVIIADEESPKDNVHMIKNFVLSYYTKRFLFFYPHVLGAILWWNLYFLQLIPTIRQKYRRFHRILGRVLMVCALAQTISGAGLAYMGNASTIKIVSYLLAISVFYCVYNAWYFAAIKKDIPKHKYWSMRLVGYLQTIALQRFCMVLLIVSHRTGWLGLYPAYSEDDGTTIEEIFKDSFTFCFPLAMLGTEWYLAGYYGWNETQGDGKVDAKVTETVRN